MSKPTASNALVDCGVVVPTYIEMSLERRMQDLRRAAAISP
jgi:hypothetical protein